MDVLRRRFPFSSVGLAAAMSTAALAQESRPDAATPVARVEITGTAASYDPRRDDTATRIVVGRDEIQRYGDGSVLDVLKRVPGITVDTNTGRGGEIRMRGLGGGYTQILINGERAAAGFSFDSLAPEMIERIEVLRAATAEFSTESVAGTINIILRRSPRKTERNAKLGLLASSVFRGPNASFDLGGREEGFSYAYTAVASQEHYRREFTGAEENVLPDGRTDMLRKMDQELLRCFLS
jgi:outer membrane receptor for ferrienterochelin and colicin